MSSNYLTPSDLKTILHSKRANIYYLEKCRVQVNGGRVEYVTSEGKESYYWNIPIANTTISTGPARKCCVNTHFNLMLMRCIPS